MRLLRYILFAFFSSRLNAKQMKFLFYSPSWGHSHLRFQGLLAMRLLRYILFAFFSSRLSAKQMKFLFYSPSWGHSHLRFQGALIDILHVLVPEFNPNIKTNGTAKAHRNDSDSAQLAIFMNVTMQFCKDFLQRKDLIEELQAEHYDVGFTEFFDYCPIDNFVPFINAPNLSISQRFMNFAFTFLSRKVSFASAFHFFPKTFSRIFEKFQNSMFRSMVREDFPDLRLLAQNAPAAFINSPQIVDIPRPISSKIVYVGGIAMKKRSNLSEVDSDSNYSNGLLNNYPNVHVFKWIDQVSILRNEYLAEFGNFPDLNLYGAEIGSFQYFLLDIFLIIFVVIVCLFFVIAKIGCIISR
uniref:glucuronosyltransferase n=1 Tax=Parascaris equorum TaxID=6256 RepID=A0A914S302_PAREQ